MRFKILSACLVLLTLVTAMAQADDANSARLAGAIAPFVDDQTLFVAHMDLRAIDAQSGVTKLIDVFALPKGTAEEFKGSATALGQHIDALKQHGVQDIFALVNIADFPGRPVTLVLPLARDTDTAKIVNELSLSTFLGGELESARFDGNLVIAAPATIKRLRAQQRPAARPEIAQAFEAVADSAVQILFVPSAQSRRVVEEMMPVLPSFAGEGPIKPFTSGLRWAAVGATIPPKSIAVKVVAQAADAPSATSIAQELANLITALGKQPFITEMIPKFGELTKFLVPTVQGDRLTLDWTEANGGLKAIVAIVGPPVDEMRTAAANARSMNNLKQFGLAMHNFLAVNKVFPPRAILSKDGKPLLSWRVTLLPFFEGKNGNALYKEFKLDEPWDSEHNRKLIERMPEIMRSPHSTAAAGRTTYLTPIMPGAIFGGSEGMSPKQIGDGLSNTILLVEADDDHAVVWTKPEDIEIDVDDPSKGLLVGLRKTLIALFADGSAHLYPAPEGREPALLKARITASGAEPVSQ